uniref:Phosphatidylinositol-4-phosphate 5-kinase related n=1 Tax=Schistosoma mansoni TaxID=6183 RepID=A0A3Q0KQ76_SCHMA
MPTGSRVGQMCKIKLNGMGTYLYKNGYYKYEGEWINGKKCGEFLALPNIIGTGRFSMKDGSIYEGSFIDGEICGSGRRFYAISKNEYIGHFMFGERHGYGLMKYGNGSTYEGDWYHNLQQGHGKYVDVDKNKYVGEFFRNKKNGPGCLYSHKFSYIGYWKNNIYDGYGIMKMINGMIYEGEFKNGKPNGQGKLTRKANLLPSYEGLWKDGLPCQVANHMNLSVELEKEHLESNSSCLVEYRNSPIKERSYKFASSSKIEIGLNLSEMEFNIDICVYNNNRRILIEESHRQLALWIGKVRKDNMQMKFPVDLQIPVETPLLLSLKEKGIFTMETPFGSYIYPVGSVKLISSKTVTDEQNSLVHSTDDNVDHGITNLNLNEEDKRSVNDQWSNSSIENENQRLSNEVFIYKQSTNRGFISYSMIKSFINNENTNDTIHIEEDVKSTSAIDGVKYCIDLSQIEKLVLLFEEFTNTPCLNQLQAGEQFILVVEDITPRNEEENEEFHMDTIPDHILRTPERLSPLFIKLYYASDK